MPNRPKGSLPAPLRTPLILLPTPCHRLNRASEELGIDLWIKRDDLTGFAFGGNKGRKLEYLMTEVLASGAKVVVTSGSADSNFVRQLGAACAVRGLVCHAAVMENPYPEGKPLFHAGHKAPKGNVALGRILDVQYHLIPDGDWSVLEAASSNLAAELSNLGQVYEVPLGGSSVAGAYSFYLAGQELSSQLGDVDFVVTASSSGSTQTGLAMYFQGSQTRVVGISADPEPEIVDDLSDLSGQLAELVDRPPLRPDQFNFHLSYVGPGYGVPSDAGNLAIEWLSRREGIFLDPIYSGKAFSGLLDLVGRREVSGRIVFWHTGGLPALFSSGFAGTA